VLVAVVETMWTHASHRIGHFDRNSWLIAQSPSMTSLSSSLQSGLASTASPLQKSSQRFVPAKHVSAVPAAVSYEVQTVVSICMQGKTLLPTPLRHALHSLPGSTTAGQFPYSSSSSAVPSPPVIHVPSVPPDVSDLLHPHGAVQSLLHTLDVQGSVAGSVVAGAVVSMTPQRLKSAGHSPVASRTSVQTG